MKKYTILLNYIYNERSRLEGQVRELQDAVRFRRITSIDCVELLIAMERLAAFNDFARQVTTILKIEGGEDDDCE